MLAQLDARLEAEKSTGLAAVSDAVRDEAGTPAAEHAGAGPIRRLGPERLASAAALRRQSDERLVELVRGGHEPAFEAIVERYRTQLLRYCGRFLPAARAEDATQQT